MQAPAKSVRETQVIEINAVARGLSIETLMENSGRVVAEETARRLPPAPAPVAILCGTGNNGGDGLAAAYYLAQWGYRCEIWLLRPPTEIRTAPARHCYDRIAARQPVHVGAPTAEHLRSFPLLVDAMLGWGQSGALRTPYREAVEQTRVSGAPTLSIDEPTGLGNPEALRPRWTVALEFPKEGMTPANSGDILVRSIGIPPEAERETGPGDFLFYPVPPVRGRNMRTGRLVIVGGGPYSGAPALAGLAALRAGAERSIILAPIPAADRVAGYSPSLIVRPVGQDRFRSADVAELEKLVASAHADAIVVGMGVGDDLESATAMAEFVHWARGQSWPLVVDADALGALAVSSPESPKTPGVARLATPNRHEYDRHFGGLPGDAEARLERVGSEAGQRGLTFVVKDDVDLISDGNRSYSNRHHHPAMTVGGVGDVLSGVLGSLLARGVESLEAARLATFWVGEAGLRAYEEKSWGLVATDVVEQLAGTLRDGLRRVEN